MSVKLRKCLVLSGLVIGMCAVACFAAEAGAEAAKAGPATIGTLATNITKSFDGIGKLMIGVAYLAGIGFGISAIFKFKQHRDNPSQVTIGTPFALMAISCALIFLPSLYKPAGATIYGTQAKGGGFTGAGVKSFSELAE